MTHGFCGDTSHELSLRCLCLGFPASELFAPGGVGPSVLTLRPVTKNSSGGSVCAAPGPATRHTAPITSDLATTHRYPVTLPLQSGCGRASLNAQLYPRGERD